MGSVNRVQVGDVVYEAVDANVKGGMVVIPSATATISGAQGAKPAGAGATDVLGVAEKDAVTEANLDALTSSTGPAPSNNFITDATVPTATFTAYNDCITWGIYKAGTAVTYRQPLKAAANGEVTLFVEGTDPEGQRIGWCAQKGGVGTGGGAGKVRILV